MAQLRRDRTQAEDTRLQAEQQVPLVVEAATDAVITIDENSTITLVNPAVTRIFGHSSAEIVGQPLTVLMPHEAGARHVQAIREYVRTDERHFNWEAVEAIAVRKNGEAFPVEISFAEVVSGGQRTFTGFIRDVTERKQAEAMRADTLDRLPCEPTSVPRSPEKAHSVTCCRDAPKPLSNTSTRRSRASGWSKTRACSNFTPAPASTTHLYGPHSRVPVGQLKIGLIAERECPTSQMISPMIRGVVGEDFLARAHRNGDNRLGGDVRGHSWTISLLHLGTENSFNGEAGNCSVLNVARVLSVVSPAACELAGDGVAGKRRGNAMSPESRRLAGALLVIFPTVMIGGISILTLLINDPAYMRNPLRQDLWRAGHAHAGVFLVFAGGIALR